MAAAEPTASPGWRALIALLGLSCIVAAIFMAGFSVAAGDSPDCDDRAAVRIEIREEGEDASCWNNSGLKAASIGLGWISATLFGFAALVAVAVVVTGRLASRILPVVGVAFVPGALAFLLAVID